MNDQIKFMQRAIDLAVENVRLRAGGPFGAVIVKDGRIVAEGTNLVTSLNDPTAHAGWDFYTSREPCPICLGAICQKVAESGCGLRRRL